MHRTSFALTSRRLLALVIAGIILAGCSAGGQNSVSMLLEREKTLFRKTVAEKIGASPEELRRAFDNSRENERVQAASYTKKVVARMGASDDVAMRKHLQSVVKRLVKPINSHDIPYKVVLIEDEQINAFTPGGGIIVVQEGLLMFCDTEGQIAAVLAHEIAHILRRDPKRLQRYSLVRRAGDRLMDAVTPEVLQDNVAKVLRLGGKATLNSAIRSQESEADSIAIDIMVAAGYDPNEMVRLQSQLRQLLPQQSRLANLLHGQHPLSRDRETAARDRIAKFYPTVGGDVTSAKYQRLIRAYDERRQKRLASKL